MPQTQPILSTARLVLRPFHTEDGPMVEHLAGDEAVARHMMQVPHPYPPGAAAAWIHTHFEEFERGVAAHFAITFQATGELCGAISLGLERQHERGGMGYWLGRPYWGQGYATEAVRAMIAFGFTELGLNRIAADHFVANPASGNVMRKAGMRHEGTLREYYLKNGAHVDVELYAIIAREWHERA